jgi:hypothetical protein
MRIITTDNINIRLKPDVKSKSLSVLKKGSVVNVADVPAIPDPKEKWHWLKLADRDGYIAKEYTQQSVETNSILYAQTNVRIRYSPGLNGPVIGLLQSGSSVKVGQPLSLDGYIWRPIIDAVKASWVAERSIDNRYIFLSADPIKTSTDRIYKAGFHIHQGYSNRDQLVEYARDLYMLGKPIAVATIINDPALCNGLSGEGKVFTISRRVDTDHDPTPIIPNDENHAIEAGRNFVANWWNSTYEHADNASALQFTNETGWDPFDYAFNIGIMKECEARGRKAIIFNDGVGNPDTDDWAKRWERRIPAMQYAWMNEHYAGYHGYGSRERPDALASDLISQEWYSLRYRKAYALMPANARPHLVISETGTFNARKSGAVLTIKDILAYEKLLMEDPYVIGFGYWTIGGTGYNWQQSSIDDYLPDIIDALKKR